MLKRNTCNICGQKKSPYVMDNKLVCLRCDELLFDIEIELEETKREEEKRSERPVTLRAETVKK